MTDIEAKALALVNEVWKERGYPPEDEVRREDIPAHEALCRAVERHEAFKQKVSDAVETHFKSYFTPYDLPDIFKQFIIKPDPLVEVLGDLEWYNNSPECAAELRAALDALGFEIREKGQ